jgi:hypothetical protein
MTQQDSRSPSGHAGPSSFGLGDNRSWFVGMCVATVLTYLAQPALAVVWAGVAIAAALVVLSREHGARAPAIVALVLAGAGLLSTLVRLGALY